MTISISSADVDMEDIEEIQYVTENEHLTFDVIAWNEKNINDILTFDVRNLPEGATFTQSPNDPNTYIFSWTPGPGTARSYPYRVTFIATSSDGYDDEDEDVRIFVREVDKTTLLNTILSATGKIASVVPGNEVGQYPQASIDAFRIAIDTARRVADDPTATQNQVNDAVIALNNAEAIFDAARITSIDKSALTVAIAAANTKVTTASPGTGIGQYPQVAIDAFRIAIDTAQGVVDDPNATIAEVSQAVTDLKAAEDTFDASRQMPPASVTDLRETATGTNWIHWEWTNPTDADFSHVMVYIDGVFVTTTPNNYYNATGFLEGTVHAIGIQTVDTAGNINPATMTDQATTRTIDRTPPAPVTDLYASSIGESWIHWTWTNPNDADFSHVRIYIDGTFVTTTPSNSYNATGLSNGAEHTIAIETVDTSGNVNTAQVSDTAITLKLPVISLVAGKNIRATSITLEWVASEETATVQISVNGTHLDTVTGSTYVHNDLNESTTYNYTLVPFNQNGLKGEAISISLATSSSSGGGSSGGSSTSIDKSELTAAIAAANTKVTTASPGTGIGQYPQAAIDAFRIAINTAQGVVDDPNATIAEVIQAITDLKAAEATFDASRQIPPASVTDLRETATGTNWIHWEWTNPPDADFDHVKIYIDDAFVTTTPSNSYNATGFTEGTVHTIGIQTVDTVGNINPTMVTDQATTMTINTTDTTPPASVTDLRETATGTNWIHWEWTNPADADFSHVMVYLDNVFVTNTSNGSYYATGLGDVYISDLNLKDEWVKIMNSGSFAVDLTGWEIKDEGDLHTYKFPSFQLGAGEAVTLYTTKGTNTGTELYWGSGGFVWNDDGDTAYLYNSGGYLLDSLKGGATHTMKATSHVLSTRTVDISGNINTTWVNDSATTSSSSSSGSSGGSGGAGSVEDFANIALKDVATRYLRMNAYVTYEFTREGNPIQSISFYSLKNSGEITSTIEVLNGRSKLVPMNPNGLLYKYINIWVGKAGFATPANIGNTQVRFIVSNSWMEEMGINPSNIKLQRYNGGAWEVLPTTFESNITDHAVFESRTPGFSPFAITAEKEPTYSLNSDSEADQTHTTDTAMEKTKPKKSNIWTYIMAFLLIAILAVGYEYLKRK